MNSKRTRVLVISIVNLIILAGLIYYLYANADKYLHLLDVSISGVVFILLLVCISPVIKSLINVYTFRSLDIDLSFREGFYLAASATLANQLPLPGGIVARGVYLKHRYHLSYAKYFSATLALFFCSISLSGFSGLIILAAWALWKQTEISPILLLGFMAMAASIAVFLLPVKKIKLPQKIQKWVNQAIEGWEIMRSNPILLAKILGLQLGFMLLFATRQWIAFTMLSQAITFGQAVLLSAGSILTQLISFAPGGLGVREAIVGGIATILGFPLTASVAAVELDRAIALVVIVLLGWISTVTLGNQMVVESAAENETPEQSE